MQIEIKIPSVGESVKEAVLVQWYKNDGDRVQKDEPLFLIETDKITLEVTAEADGVLKISAGEGETVAIGAVVGFLDTEAAQAAAEKKPPTGKKSVPLKKPSAGKKAPPSKAAPAKAQKATAAAEPEPQAPEKGRIILSPSVRRLAAGKNIDLAEVSPSGPGGRVTKGDVLLFLEQAAAKPGKAAFKAPAPPKPRPEAPDLDSETEKALSGSAPGEPTSHAAGISRKPMTPIRQRIAARLLEAKQNTAMLTTFNEIDMSRVMEIRARLKEKFKQKHGVSLGLMSFFIKATVEALKEFPEINASIDGQDILYHHYYHIGIAIGTARGLIVPVIRHADRLGFAELEQAIVDFVDKINTNRLGLADLEGGTFTISNGGVYGSLLSTPILNMPQSGILGMHKIENRPVAADGKVVVHPMMYVALSYDHRMVDGREAVTFLKRIKECIEKPEEIMMET